MATAKKMNENFNVNVPFDKMIDLAPTNMMLADPSGILLYMNTNNGKTIFEDGEEVDSVENRMVIFPASRMHAGTTHTDAMYRCVINFNWF